MCRRLRFHPRDSLVEITCRTVQGRLLLQPTPRVAELCRGVLARAARLYPVRIHAFVFLGNHYHLLLSAPSAQRLAAFMRYLNSNLAREVGRAVGWREKFWGRRYQAILVSDEEPAQVGRLLYILRHGCKENLVRRPVEWPGATAVGNLLAGDPVTGSWLDRSGLYEANRGKRRAVRRGFLTRERLDLSPLPCWSRLAPEAFRRRVADLVRLVEQETERRILESGREPLGRERVQSQEPHRIPDRVKRTPAPLVHAASKDVRDAIRKAYWEFVAAFRRASERIRRGFFLPELIELFPLGSFPPSGPFVQSAPAAPG